MCYDEVLVFSLRLLLHPNQRKMYIHVGGYSILKYVINHKQTTQLKQLRIKFKMINNCIHVLYMVHHLLTRDDQDSQYWFYLFEMLMISQSLTLATTLLHPS